MDKEYLTYRFGFMAVEKGFAKPEQISKALEIQSEENEAGKTHRRIGEILVDMGSMSGAQVAEVLDIMFKKRS